MNDDTISRQAAIDATLTFIVEYCGAAFDKDMQKMLCERLDALPSAEPERKRGKWLPYLPEGLRYKCSECGSRYDTPWNFCPECGSYNGGGQSEND